MHEWFQVQLITFLKCFGEALGKAKDCELFFLDSRICNHHINGSNVLRDKSRFFTL